MDVVDCSDLSDNDIMTKLAALVRAGNVRPTIRIPWTFYCKIMGSALFWEANWIPEDAIILQLKPDTTYRMGDTCKKYSQ